MSRARFIYGVVCDSELVYIGSSYSLVLRQEAHASLRVDTTRDAVAGADRVRFVTFGCLPYDEADEAEALWIKYAIDQGCPLLNVRGRDGVVAWARARRRKPRQTFIVQVPKSVQETLREMARVNRRSMGAQAAFLIDQQWKRVQREEAGK